LQKTKHSSPGALAIPEDENAKGTQGGIKKLHNTAQN
jgi:hypothetical protein